MSLGPVMLDIEGLSLSPADRDLLREPAVGGVILFTRFIDMLFHPIVVLGEQTNVLFRAMASGERIFQALDWDELIHEPEQPVTLPTHLSGELRFEKLNFAYDADMQILHDVTFTISPGEKLAIVGPTGSGKSSIIDKYVNDKFDETAHVCISILSPPLASIFWPRTFSTKPRIIDYSFGILLGRKDSSLLSQAISEMPIVLS